MVLGGLAAAGLLLVSLTTAPAGAVGPLNFNVPVTVESDPPTAFELSNEMSIRLAGSTVNTALTLEAPSFAVIVAFS